MKDDGLQQQFERLLHWYPKKWRIDHGDALIDMLMNRAEDPKRPDTSLRRERTNIMLAGLSERTRFAVPLTAGVLSALALVTGMVLASTSVAPLGELLWFAAAPALLVLAVGSLTAAVDGRWSSRVILATGVGILAVGALLLTAWLAYLGDDLSAAPPVEAMWGAAAIYASLTGAIATIALVPPLTRGGIGRAWASILTFISGAVGGLVTALLLISGVGIMLAAALTVVLTLHLRRRIKRARAAHSAAI